MSDNANTSDLSDLLDRNRSKNDIEDIRSILGDISQIDLPKRMPQSIKNQKADVTMLFFPLIDLFSKFFEKSILPRNQNRLLFAYFLSLHHYAVDLYCPGISHSDAEFTSLWNNFSWIFKMIQPYMFPNDYNHVIEQINREFNPIRARYEGDPSVEEIFKSLKKFDFLVSDLQDPHASSDNFTNTFNEFQKLKKQISIFCQKIKLIPPHLFNSLSLTEFILVHGSIFSNIRERIKSIDFKVQEFSIISIHAPSENKEPSIHRRFLIASVKIHQVETRLIYGKMVEMNNVNLTQNTNNPASQDIFKEITHKFYLSTTILLDFSSVINLYLDSTLMQQWKFYVGNSASYLSLIDQPINILLQKQGSQNFQNPQNPQNRPQAQQNVNLIKSRSNEQINIMNLKNEISFQNQISSVFAYYEEFLRLYNFVANDSSPRVIHPLSHCIILLLKISNESDNSSIKNSVMKVIDSIVSHLITAKAREDLVSFEYIIKKIIDLKRKKEQYQQMQLQQLRQMQQGQISSSNSLSNLNSTQYLTLNSKIDDSPYQILVALADNTREMLKLVSANGFRPHQAEYANFLNSYSNYLDLLVAVSARKFSYMGVDGAIPVEYLKYHPNIDLIADCLKKFSSDIINEKQPFSATVPPVIFSSYPTRNAKLDPSDMQRIASLLLTERWKEHDAQYIVMRFARMKMYINQVAKFVEFFSASVPIESKLNIEDLVNSKLMNFVNNLINFQKEKSIFNLDESKEMAENIFPLFLKAMYKRILMKVRIEEIVYKIISNLYIPRCPDLIKRCYVVMDSLDNLLTKNPSIKQQVTDLKLLMAVSFSGSNEFHKCIQYSKIAQSIATVNNEMKKNDPNVFEDSKNCLDDFEKYLVLCRRLDSISEYFKDYKIGKHGTRKPNQSDVDHPIGQDSEKADENQNENNEDNKGGDDGYENEVAINDEAGQSDDENENGSQNKNENDEKSSENESKDPYKISYVAILAKVNHVSLMRQKLIDAKKMNMLSSPNPNDSMEQFYTSLIKEIDDALGTNKFFYINQSSLDNIIKKFVKQFNLMVVLKNLINYFEECAVYLRNVNEMSAVPELVSDRKLKLIKTQLNETINNPQNAAERISNTVLNVKELCVNTKTLESIISQQMALSYIERAQTVLTLLLLIKYPMNLDLNALVPSSFPTIPAINPASLTQAQAQAVAAAAAAGQASQAISQVRYQTGANSTISYIYNQNKQQQNQPQQQQASLTPFQLQQLQKIQIQQQIPQTIQFVQNPTLNQTSISILGQKYSFPFQIFIPNHPHMVCVNKPTQQQIAAQQAAAAAASMASLMGPTLSQDQLSMYAQKILKMFSILNELQRTPIVISAIEKCKEMYNGAFIRYYNFVSSMSLEDANNLQLSELKTLKANIKTNICKLEASTKKTNLPLLNEHFERCLRLIDKQTKEKDNQINELKETINALEENLREMDRKMSRRETAPPEVISALDSILSDDLLASIVGPEKAAAAEGAVGKILPLSMDLNGPQSGRRKGKSKNRLLIQKNDDDLNEAAPDQNLPSAELSANASSSTIEKVKPVSKKSSASVVNSLLSQVKNAEILNQRLHRKVERLRFPSSSTPLPSDQFTSAYPLNLDTYEGCSWIANNVKESSSNRNELSKLIDERDSLFEQMIRTNASKSALMKPETIENLYGNIVSACASANSNSSMNGKVSKSTFLSFIEKSDNLFISLDYDINAIKKKLKMINRQSRMTPSEHVAQFAKKLQNLE